MEEERKEEKEQEGPFPEGIVDDDGNRLYGFSSTHLAQVYKLMWILVVVLVVFLIVLLYIIWKVQKWGIIGKFIVALAAC